MGKSLKQLSAKAERRLEARRARQEASFKARGKAIRDSQSDESENDEKPPTNQTNTTSGIGRNEAEDNHQQDEKQAESNDKGDGKDID